MITRYGNTSTAFINLNIGSVGRYKAPIFSKIIKGCNKGDLFDDHNKETHKDKHKEKPPSSPRPPRDATNADLFISCAQMER